MTVSYFGPKCAKWLNLGCRVAWVVHPMGRPLLELLNKANSGNNHWNGGIFCQEVSSWKWTEYKSASLDKLWIKCLTLCTRQALATTNNHSSKLVITLGSVVEVELEIFGQTVLAWDLWGAEEWAVGFQTDLGQQLKKKVQVMNPSK